MLVTCTLLQIYPMLHEADSSSMLLTNLSTRAAKVCGARSDKSLTNYLAHAGLCTDGVTLGGACEV